MSLPSGPVKILTIGWWEATSQEYTQKVAAKASFIEYNVG